MVTKSDDAAASNSETDAGSAETNAGVIGEDGSWTVADTFDDSELPSGFTATEIEYEGRSVKAATDDSGMTLLYMTDDSGNGDSLCIQQRDRHFICLCSREDGREDSRSASGLSASRREQHSRTVLLSAPSISEITTVHGWIWKDSGDSAPEYCVVYGRNENGEEGFYRYDQKEMTLQRYFQDPDAADARSKYLKVAEDYNSLLKDYEIRGMFVIGLFALSTSL